MGEPQYRLEGVIRTKDEQMEDFEGPLDVIFLLLSKNKIEIQDVSITAILEQYLAYLDEMKRLDMEIASEFITMASHLMLIKTKMLLSAAEAAEAALASIGQATVAPEPQTVARRTSTGALAVGAPTADEHAVSRQVARATLTGKTTFTPGATSDPTWPRFVATGGPLFTRAQTGLPSKIGRAHV